MQKLYNLHEVFANCQSFLKRKYMKKGIKYEVIILNYLHIFIIKKSFRLEK